MIRYFTIVCILLWGCSSAESGKSAPPQPSPSAAPQAPHGNAVQEPTQKVVATAFTRITDPSTVCMVTDRYMGAAQIPVVVEGKTYYGCCKMCEKRLNEEPSVRRALDPISKQEVDKALAVLAKDGSGAVFYFADEASLAKANGGG